MPISHIRIWLWYIRTGDPRGFNKGHNPKTLNDKNHQASSQKFRQLMPREVFLREELLYSHLHVRAATQRHNDKDARRKDTGRKGAWRKTQEGRRKKTSLTIFYLSLYFKCSKGLFKGLHVRGCWRPNINFIFWPPLLMTVTLCLSCSLRCSTRGLGVHCWMLAFFTASYQHLLWTPVHQGFKTHRPGVAFLTTYRL